jgi:hypothetical protein
MVTINYLTEPDHMTVEEAWAELDYAGADPRAHVVASDDAGATCVHLLESTGQRVTFPAADLSLAVRRALHAWRSAEVLLARRRGLLPDSELEVAAMPDDAVRMAVDAAMALRDLEARR